jgi:uncharacterized protein
VSKPRYVFDTSATVSALLFEHSTPADAFYAAIERGELLLSAETFSELCGVLRRPKFDRYVTDAEREQFLVKLLLQAALVEIDAEIHACRDPKDDKFLELAVCGAAACIITGDADLLALNPYRGIPIMTPANFLDFLSAS